MGTDIFSVFLLWDFPTLRLGNREPGHRSFEVELSETKVAAAYPICGIQDGERAFATVVT